ncbi:hypothetical protein CH252_05855 [Rhodococcus sp. 06-1477-1B]|nr:hypothetical protein CH252_05855 [Rhodococcus sp. 06-1477-1B]
MTTEAAPAPNVTVTVTATPVPAAPTSNDERLAELRAVSQQVTGVEETEPGRWIVHTSITDPGAGISGSPGAQKAITLCEKAVALGAAKVVVTDADGSSWILYGHPSYGNTCTEV